MQMHSHLALFYLPAKQLFYSCSEKYREIDRKTSAMKSFLIKMQAKVSMKGLGMVCKFYGSDLNQQMQPLKISNQKRMTHLLSRFIADSFFLNALIKSHRNAIHENTFLENISPARVRAMKLKSSSYLNCFSQQNIESYSEPLSNI